MLIEKGYPGSYSAFTHIARQIEEELGINSQEAYVKLEPIKGSIKVDFGEGWVIENGVTGKNIYSVLNFVTVKENS